MNKNKSFNALILKLIFFSFIIIISVVSCKKNDTLDKDSNIKQALQEYLKLHGGKFNDGKLSFFGNNNNVNATFELDWNSMKTIITNENIYYVIDYTESNENRKTNSTNKTNDTSLINYQFKLVIQKTSLQNYELRILQNVRSTSLMGNPSFDKSISFFRLNGNQTRSFVINKFNNYRREIYPSINQTRLNSSGQNFRTSSCVSFSVPIRQPYCYLESGYDAVCGFSIVGYNSYTFCFSQQQTQETFNIDDFLSGYGGGGSNGSSNIIPQIVKDSSIEMNNGVKCIFEALMSDSSTFGLASLVTAFQGQSGCNIIFKLKNIPVAGKTSPLGNGSFEISISRNDALDPSYSRIWLASTILHEAFHANLMQKVWATFGDNFTSSSPIPIEDMTLKELISFAEFTASGNVNWNNTMHEFLSNNIFMLESGIRNFVQANYPSIYSSISGNPNAIRDLAFMGMEDYSGFKNIYGDQSNLIYQSNLGLFVNSAATNCP